jgi:hypothetical protein
MEINEKQKVIEKSKLADLIFVAILAASASVIVGIYMQFPQQMAQQISEATGIGIQNAAVTATENPTSTNSLTKAPGTPVAATIVSPNQSINKEFWINTVHFDGMTNVHAAVKCDTCNQNIPLHPAEKFPNSTLPAGTKGLVLTPPNKAGAWDFRSFAFAPSQIIVSQGDAVTLHFEGVQGFHHVITVEGVGTFPLDRGQIYTVSFIANKPGTISYFCHIHVPNMVGQILVLPKPMRI